MNLEVLKIKLSENNVPNCLYSLDDEIKPNAYILYKNYLKWECFFLDEKGNRNDLQTFNNDEDACNYFWTKIELELKYPPSISPFNIYG